MSSLFGVDSSVIKALGRTMLEEGIGTRDALLALCKWENIVKAIRTYATAASEIANLLVAALRSREQSYGRSFRVGRPRRWRYGATYSRALSPVGSDPDYLFWKGFLPSNMQLVPVKYDPIATALRAGVISLGQHAADTPFLIPATSSTTIFFKVGVRRSLAIKNRRGQSIAQVDRIDLIHSGSILLGRRMLRFFRLTTLVRPVGRRLDLEWRPF